MAEALSLIGLVSNIFQFIELGGDIVSASKQAYQSAQGTTVVVKDLRLLAEDIKHTGERATGFQSSPPSKDEIAIRNYAAECDVFAQELLPLLDKLTVKPGSKFQRLESLRVGFQGAAKKKDLDKLEGRLKDLDGRMRTRLSNAIDDKRHSRTVALLEELDRGNKRMDIISSSRFENLRRTISTALASSHTQTTEVINLLGQLHNRAEVATKHQRILRDLMFNQCGLR